jgi:hypothetical protein
LWWTVKHEWVYLRPAANGIDQKRRLAEPGEGLAQRFNTEHCRQRV